MLATPLSPRHLDQVEAIERASFPSPWPRRFFMGYIQHEQALPLAALVLPSSLLAGYVCLWLEDRWAQVQNLAVHPAYRRRGVGRVLLMEGLRECRRRGARVAALEVRPSNLAARRLYNSLGFAEKGRKPGYYQPGGEDALILECDLMEASFTAEDPP